MLEVQKDKFYKNEKWGKELSLFFKVGIMSCITGTVNINISTTTKTNQAFILLNFLLYNLTGNIQEKC